jgi:hypothetical protein
MSRPMIRVSGDPTAAALISALIAEGVTVDDTRRAAILDFYSTVKPLAAWNSLVRLQIPGFQNAEADRVCWKDAAKRGTWVGTITRNNGTVATSASTNYFDHGIAPAALGMTVSSLWMGKLFVDASGNLQSGCQQSSSQSLILGHVTTPGLRSETCGSSARDTSTVAAIADCSGIFSVNRSAGVTRHRLRRTSGVTVTQDYTRADTGTMPTINLFSLSRNNAGTSDQSSSTKCGAWFYGSGVSAADDAAFTFALKTLWESLFTLTLP